MDEMQLSGIPETIEQAMETLTEFYVESLSEIQQMSIAEFEASVHYGAGMFIRNCWYLWWYDGHKCDGWPKDKPTLVKYFNDLGVVDTDHMSSILMVCFYQKVHNQ